MMRAIIWNAHWATLGGGEVYAAQLAQVLTKSNYKVLLLGIHSSPISDLETRLGIFLGDIEYRKIDGEFQVSKYVNAGDLFINASFGSELPSPCSNSIYICHFPHRNIISRLRRFLDKKVGVFVFDDKFLSNTPFLNTFLVLGQGLIRVTSTKQIYIECLSGKVALTKDNDVVLELNPNSAVSVKGYLGNIRVHSESNTSSVLKIIEEPKSIFARYLQILGRRKTISFAQTYSQLWANSVFTQKHIKGRWGVSSKIVYPPTGSLKIREGTRDPYQIVGIGRFMSPARGHSKNQIELIHAFEKLASSSEKPWKLKLIGGLDDSNLSYFKRVQEAVQNSKYQIELLPNCANDLKLKIVGESSFFWHAGGLGISKKHPDKMEHFGIVVVEAIRSGLIPFVFNSAGPAEILHNYPELLYEKVSELAKNTESISNLSKSRLNELKTKILEESEQYTTESFNNNVEKILKKIENNY